MSYVAGVVAGGNVATLNITWPTVEPGDLALLFWTISANSNPVGTALTHRQTVDNTANGSVRSIFRTHKCTGSEAGTNLALTVDAANRQSAILEVYRGYADVQSGDWASKVLTSSAAVHDSPAIVTPVANAAVVAAYAERLGSGTTNINAPTGYTKRHQSGTLASGSGGTFTAVADDGLAVQRPAGTSVTPSGWNGGLTTQNIILWSVALRPELVAGRHMALIGGVWRPVAKKILVAGAWS